MTLVFVKSEDDLGLCAKDLEVFFFLWSIFFFQLKKRLSLFCCKAMVKISTTSTSN